jgi:Protein of unknown function (DUF3761)
MSLRVATGTAAIAWVLSTNALPAVAPAATAPAAPVIAVDDQCGAGMEWSKTVGRCVPAPTAAPTPPPGATFLCADGDYSFAKTSQGACSRHGGIKARIGQ